MRAQISQDNGASSGPDLLTGTQRQEVVMAIELQHLRVEISRSRVKHRVPINCLLSDTPDKSDVFIHISNSITATNSLIQFAPAYGKRQKWRQLVLFMSQRHCLASQNHLTQSKVACGLALHASFFEVKSESEQKSRSVPMVKT